MSDNTMLVQHLIEESADPCITGEDAQDLMSRAASEIVDLRAQLAEARGTKHRERGRPLAADMGGADEPMKSAPAPEPRGCAMPGCCAATVDLCDLRAQLAEAQADTKRLDKIFELLAEEFRRGGLELGDLFDVTALEDRRAALDKLLNLNAAMGKEEQGDG